MNIYIYIYIYIHKYVIIKQRNTRTGDKGRPVLRK